LISPPLASSSFVRLPTATLSSGISTVSPTLSPCGAFSVSSDTSSTVSSPRRPAAHIRNLRRRWLQAPARPPRCRRGHEEERSVLGDREVVDLVVAGRHEFVFCLCSRDVGDDLTSSLRLAPVTLYFTCIAFTSVFACFLCLSACIYITLKHRNSKQISDFSAVE
jgi:hypothetical protein